MAVWYCARVMAPRELGSRLINIARALLSSNRLIAAAGEFSIAQEERNEKGK